MKRHWIWLWTLAVVVIAGCATRQAANVGQSAAQADKTYPITADPELRGRLEQLAEDLEAKRQELHIPGMALAVVKDDEIVFARGFGMADLEKRIPVTPETLFAVGSTTKAFTSALVGMLAAEGKMDWDDPIEKHLPYLKLAIDGKADDAATIRDMLCHRTGFARMGILWANGAASREEVLRAAVQAEPWSPFREKFYYNNVMYLAAGVAAGKVAGSDWDRLLEDRLFEPLGMKASSVSYEAAQRDPNLSLGYRWEEELGEHRRLPMRNLGNIAPAGAINANVLDMAQWVRLQLGSGVYEGKRLIDEAYLMETRKPQIQLGPNVHYGLGWFLQDWQGQPVVQHGGNIDGYAAMVGLLPDANLGFVLLANVTATPLQQLSVNMVWDRLASAPAEEGVAGSEAAEPAAEDADPFEPYIGEYHANFGSFKDAIFTVQIQNGKLAVDVPGQMVYELKDPNEDGRRPFVMTDTIAVSFEQDERGKVVMMRVHQGGFDFEAPRKGVPIVPEIDERELRKYVGAYRSEKMNANLKAVIQNGRLAIDVPGQMVFELHLPDEQGRRAFRARANRLFAFNEAADGRVESMTLFRGDEAFETMPRVAGDEDPIPTLAEIHQLRRTEARRAAMDRLGVLRFEGSVRLAQAGAIGKAKLFIDGHQRHRQDMDFGKYGSVHNVAARDRAATDISFAPFEEHRGKFLEQAVKGSPAMIFGDWLEYYETAEVLGNDTLDGKKVHLVKLAGGETPSTTLYIDAQTGDVLKQDASLLLPGRGSFPVTNHYEDYREVEGLRIPFRFISSNEQNGKTVIQLERVETGVTVDPSFFTLEPDRE